ncbi:MAG TPA: hypothetical protein VGE27_03915 [Gemmatimonas sp.]|uniref:hypothetical protein n=1 Tax=Gemmatimonas sp. TaxID=1962908 RepID=UPI002EDB9B6B
MSQETVNYLVNLLIGVILAGVLSQYWRLEASGQSLRLWIIAAWTLAAADLFFVARSMLPPDTLPRLIPTITVTCGHALLLLAAQQTAQRPQQRRVICLIVASHLLLLLLLRAVPAMQGWRAPTNSVVWGSLSLAAALVLWRAADHVRPLMRFPAMVMAFQAFFHATRSLLATQAAVDANPVRSAAVQMLGDVEVSLFMVALFVGVLVAYLRQSNDDLRRALANVQQLSSMLPLCAWCNKVRDDDGYWRRIEEYLSEHKVSVTHSMCESCATKHFDEFKP